MRGVYDDDDDDDDDYDAINTLKLTTKWSTFYGYFETQLPELKCQKHWQINTEMERPSMGLIWRHRNVTELNLNSKIVSLTKTNINKKHGDKWYIQDVLFQETLTNALSAPWWRKIHPRVLQYTNRHYALETLTFWEHKFGICNQDKNTSLGKAPSRHKRGTWLTVIMREKQNTQQLCQNQLLFTK